MLHFLAWRWFLDIGQENYLWSFLDVFLSVCRLFFSKSKRCLAYIWFWKSLNIRIVLRLKDVLNCYKFKSHFNINTFSNKGSIFYDLKTVDENSIGLIKTFRINASNENWCCEVWCFIIELYANGQNSLRRIFSPPNNIFRHLIFGLPC